MLLYVPYATLGSITVTICTKCLLTIVFAVTVIIPQKVTLLITCF